MVDDKKLAEKLAALNRVYRERLSDQIGEMEEIARRLATDPASASGEQALEDLMALAHKMGGAAGTFGMPQLGDLARSLEERCEAILKSNDPVSEAQSNEIRAMVGACREEADSASD